MNRTLVLKVLLLAVSVLFFSIYFDLFATRKIFVHDNIIWYGSFHYYVESIAGGNFPYWNPYMMTGTYFYPNISLLGLLDPSVLISAMAVKVFGISPLTAFIYFRLFRLFVFVCGAFYLYRHITGCRLSAVIAAGVLLFSVTAAYFNQNGMIDLIYLTPLTLFFVLRFLRDPMGSKRYYFLSCAVLMTGITMNIFIPAYFLFNLIFFLIALLITGIVPIKRVSGCLRDKRLMLFGAGAAVLILLMSAPPLMVMYKDASSGGELFPILRVWQKGGFRKIVASNIGSASLSGSYTEHRGQFSSWGNMAHLVYPDVFLSLTYFADNGLLAENNQYIGIIPFLLGIIGLMYHKSRYRYLAAFMALIITINMFGFSGVNGPFNFLQKAFNAVFPPLGMIDVRQSFGSYLLMYLCMLLSLGLSIFFNKEDLHVFLKSKRLQIISVIVIIISAKTVITWYLGGRYFYASYHDLFVLCQLIFFAVLVYLYQKKMVKQSVLCIVLITLIFTDHYFYNRYAEKYVLQDSSFLYSAIGIGDAGRRDGQKFQYFRELFPAPNGLAFGEDIEKVNCVLTYGNNHSPFCTKRYYDFLTHVPLPSQFIFSGVVYPCIGFFAEGDAKIKTDKTELLNYFSQADAEALAGTLFLEAAAGDGPAGRLVELGRLGQYEEIPWLEPSSVLNYFLPKYLEKWGGLIRNMRSDPGSYMVTPVFSIAVSGFTPNETEIKVRNVSDGYLLYNDGWSKYWQAFDNGREIPVRIANYNSKAVFLARGEHSIRFVFNPVHYRIGLAAYYLGLLISVCLIFIFSRRKSPPSQLSITPAESEPAS